MCQKLAHGGGVNSYIRGTERKSPQLIPVEAALAVGDAFNAYCPQFGNGCTTAQDRVVTGAGQVVLTAPAIVGRPTP